MILKQNCLGGGGLNYFLFPERGDLLERGLNREITVLINMPIPFKLNSCRFMLPINNAANSLGLGSKKCSEHFTPSASHSTILFKSFFYYFFL